MDLGGSCARLLSHHCQLGNSLALPDSTAQGAKGLEGEGSATRCGLAKTGSCFPWVMEGTKRVRQSSSLHQRTSEENCKVFFKLMAGLGLIRVRVSHSKLLFMPTS